ncbi:MAG: hypothetical protein IKJ33_04930 [Clostridia bacterium]|nr:hypothetical protein [Clostridia bacterium]
MTKKDMNMVEKFVGLEEEIIDLLKEAEMDIDFSADRKTIMAQLKSYITKVKKVDKLFEEYETLAAKIGGSTNEEEKNQELTCAVVDLREDSEELKTEIESINGEVKVKQTKKQKNNQAVREL